MSPEASGTSSEDMSSACVQGDTCLPAPGMFLGEAACHLPPTYRRHVPPEGMSLRRTCASLQRPCVPERPPSILPHRTTSQEVPLYSLQEEKKLLRREKSLRKKISQRDFYSLTGSAAEGGAPGDVLTKMVEK